jgi:hypothetical protein
MSASRVARCAYTSSPSAVRCTAVSKGVTTPRRLSCGKLRGPASIPAMPTTWPRCSIGSGGGVADTRPSRRRRGSRVYTGAGSVSSVEWRPPRPPRHLPERGRRGCRARLHRSGGGRGQGLGARRRGDDLRALPRTAGLGRPRSRAARTHRPCGRARAAGSRRRAPHPRLQPG